MKASISIVALGNRHCAFCGSMKREEWVENRMNKLLPTSYFNMVFTLPHELNSLILGNRKILFNILFESVERPYLTMGGTRNLRC